MRISKTSAEIAKGEAVPGYVGDGLSMFTHRASKSKQARPVAVARPSVRDLIKTEEYKLRKLYAKHREIDKSDPRVEIIRKNIDIAQVFIAKLYAELGAAMRKGTA